MTTNSSSVPPSVRAAQLARVRRSGLGRAYPRSSAPLDPAALGTELAATQALLRASSAADVAAVVSTYVHDLGGSLVPARYADPAKAIPVDVSLGLAEPMLPIADPTSVAAMQLGQMLPEFLEMARLVLSRIQAEARRDEEATRDHLTGVLTRRAWMRRLSKAAPGDSVCLIDLDHFKTVNDTRGHAHGDAALSAVGALMLRTFRDGDACGRYGGDEFVVLAPRLPGPDLAARCDQLRRSWEAERPPEAAVIGFTIGVAEVGEHGGRRALLAADTAMYDGKMQGRGRTVLGSPDEQNRGGLA